MTTASQSSGQIRNQSLRVTKTQSWHQARDEYQTSVRLPRFRGWRRELGPDHVPIAPDGRQLVEDRAPREAGEGPVLPFMNLESASGCHLLSLHGLADCWRPLRSA
jgi:hypothetical protein